MRSFLKSPNESEEDTTGSVAIAPGSSMATVSTKALMSLCSKAKGFSVSFSRVHYYSDPLTFLILDALFSLDTNTILRDYIEQACYDVRIDFASLIDPGLQLVIRQKHWEDWMEHSYEYCEPCHWYGECNEDYEVRHWASKVNLPVGSEDESPISYVGFMNAGRDVRWRVATW